ncbi:MAG TPA: hypothetical protein VFM88_20380 [Vicinamibacteria bacterium]|nr:hypothetical protein [Vicinamibacteria bacterium]
MRVRFRRVLAVVLTWSPVGCATTGPMVPVVGRHVDVRPVSGQGKDAAEGELLAVEPERLLVMEPKGIRALPLAGVEQVRVKRHDWGGKRAWTWTVLGALATGGALTASCASVEDNESCGRVGLGVGLTWLLLGGLSAMSLEKSSVERVRGPNWRELAPYARFPQGFPAEVDPKALEPGAR